MGAPSKSVHRAWRVLSKGVRSPLASAFVASAALFSISVACSGEKSRAPSPSPSTTDELGPVAPEPTPEEPSPFPPATLSLKLRRTVGVRLEPFEAAKRIGTIAIDTRVGWTKVARGDGCSSVWVQIRPRGWVCSEHLEAQPELPKGDELPRLDRGEIVPGIYGKVVDQGATTMMLEVPKPAPKAKGAKGAKAPAKGAKAPAKNGKAAVAKAPPKAAPAAPITSPSQVDGDASSAAAPLEPRVIVVPGGKLVPGRPVVGSVNVRQYKELVLDGKLYWKISPTENEYLTASSVHKHTPSEYQGARLGDDTGLTGPIAFVWPRAGAKMAWTRSTAKVGTLRQIPRRLVVPLLETALDPAGKPFAYRIGPAEWIDAFSLRLFTPAPPPPNLLPNERWIDIDLDAQILVAYEGALPVYATLVSAGAKLTPTETGVYRMWKKMAETDMNGLTGEDPYSVATVPWTQFFSPEKGLALHTSYWHDGFGTARSHGCINLAPADARWLYFWSEPQVPAGWTMAAGVSEAPGSIVRVRSKADPAPEIKGYAKRVEEMRSAGEPTD